MTLQNLGSIGEFVTAIATLVTLVYVAVQIRQNTKMVRGATYQQVTAAHSALADQLIRDP